MNYLNCRTQTPETPYGAALAKAGDLPAAVAVGRHPGLPEIAHREPVQPGFGVGLGETLGENLEGIV